MTAMSTYLVLFVWTISQQE